MSDALFILLVEKDAAFMRLAEDRFYNTYPCIIITAKGQPDVASRWATAVSAPAAGVSTAHILLPPLTSFTASVGVCQRRHQAAWEECCKSGAMPTFATARRLFLRKLKMELKIPVLALVDSDPYGLKILAVYMKGARNTK